MPLLTSLPPLSFRLCERHGRMNRLEAPRQRQWFDANYRQGILRFLDNIGLHKVRSGKYVRFSSDRLWQHHGLIRLAPTTRGLPWAKA